MATVYAGGSYVGWKVEVLNKDGATWVGSGRTNLKNVIFETYQEAFQALITYGSHGVTRVCKYRIVDGSDTAHWRGTRQEAINQKELVVDLISDLPVINVSRQGLIDALQPKLDAEVAEREAAEAAKAEKEKEFEDAVLAFTKKELVAIVRNFWTGDTSKVKEAKDKDQFKPKKSESAPSPAETDLGRAVRVLGLSSDETVELRPGTNLYNLL